MYEGAGTRLGTQSVATLDPGDSADVRFLDVRLKTGQHALTARSGAPRAAPSSALTPTG
jgi:hypothetical protein